MKKPHRIVHRLVWVLVLPLLLLIVVHAQQGRFAIEDKYEASELPAGARELP